MVRAVSIRSLSFLSPFVLFGFWWWLSEQAFVYFSSRYYSSSFIRFSWYAALLLFVMVLSKCRRTRRRESRHLLEIVFACVVLIIALPTYFTRYGDQILTAPRRDMGQITQQAAVAFFRNKDNPYKKKDLAAIRTKSGEIYAGFKYGPVMFFGFGASAFLTFGIKITNVVLFALTVLLAVMLCVSKEFSLMQNLARAVFVFAAVIVPERIWYELFVSGAPDLLPGALVLASLVALKNDKTFLAGLLAGLSVSAKVAPAIFLIAVYMRWPLDRKMWKGVVIGLFPTILFCFAAPAEFFNNVILFHAVKGYSASSIISITPLFLHWIFPLIQFIAVVLTIKCNCSRSLTASSAMFSYLVLLAIIEMTYGEVHGNHLLWFLPVVAVALSAVAVMTRKKRLF